MMIDPYENFADSHDRFEGAYDQHDPAEVSFFERLFAEYQVKRVLDCACGTGHHLHMSSLLGAAVMGSDISPAMLRRAAHNLADAGMNIPLLEADYRSLPDYFNPDFDAVLCLRSSILHMPSPDEALKAFVSMHSVLRPGGILVLTQGTTDRQWREKPRFLLAVNESEFTRLFVIDYEGKGARYNILDIHHSDRQSGLESFSVEYPNILLQEEQEHLLHKAGFETVLSYGNYQFDLYSKETSRRLILVAVR